MCYINLSHTLCSSKYTTHKFLIKCQGIFAHPLLSNLFDKPTRRQELKNTRNPMGSCGLPSPGPGLCFRSSSHCQVPPIQGYRAGFSESRPLGEARCRTVVPFHTEFLNNQNYIEISKFLSPLWNNYFQLLSHSSDTALAYDLVLRDKQSRTEYWQCPSQWIFFEQNWLVWIRFSKVLIML